jgi:colanic acid biosynthesis glycosyl transferase WcaI
MRFLILTQYFPPEIGAAPTRLPAIAGELKRLGHEIEVVTALPNYPKGRIFSEYENCFYRREEREGIVVHRVWIYAGLGRGFERVLNYGSFALTSLFGLARAQRPDYLFLESPPLFLAVPAVIAAKIWRVPLILNVADLWPDVIAEAGILEEGLLLHILRRLERWSYRQATLVNAVTQGIRECLLHKKSVPAREILFLPNGVDTSRFRPLPPDRDFKRRLGLQEKRVILWAGTQGQSHALEYVVEAAALLRDLSEIHFLFVGDGTARAELERQRDRIGLSNVSFCDAVPPDQLPAYFSIADCGLASLRDVPGHDGARPSKILPILACGKPVIFVGRGEGAELIERAQAGIRVPPGDPVALSQAVRHFFEDPESLEQMGRNGRRFVETELPWSKLVENWLCQLERSQSKPMLASLERKKKTAVPIQQGEQ